MDFQKALKGARGGIRRYRAYRYMRNAEWPGDMRDYLLDRLGLEEKHTAASIFGGVGFFALGLLVGSALGVIFAPMSGSEMRTTMRDQGMRGVMEKTRATIQTPSA